MGSAGPAARARRWACGGSLILALALAAPAWAAPSLLELGRFAQPVWAGSPPDDRARVFVAERAGRIRVIENGEISTFMDISGSVLSNGSERGLLSLAFPADYATSRKLYAYVTAQTDGRIEVREYVGSDVASMRVLLTVPHPDAGNHNGGQLQFGPDGRLYAATGDGGGGNDQYRHAQNPASNLGKLLRIDVATGAVDQVSRGLRNPWRFSFAPSGEIVIADVGQGAVEEVNVGLAADYGWPCFEGRRPGPRIDEPCRTGSAPPVLEKTHGGDGFCSITGGYVVRDPGLPTLLGRYVYGDFCAPALRSVNLADTSTDAPVGIDVNGLSSFGEDACGRLLVVSLNGPVWRMTDGASTPCEPEEPTPTPTATATVSPTATASPPPVPTAPASPQPVTPTPTVGPVAFPEPAPCSPWMRVTGQRKLAVRRYLTVAIRTNKPCRVTVSARHFRRATVSLKPGQRRVVKLRRTRGKAKRVTVTVRGPGGTIRQTVRAR